VITIVRSAGQASVTPAVRGVPLLSTRPPTNEHVMPRHAYASSNADLTVGKSGNAFAEYWPNFIAPSIVDADFGLQ